MAKIYWLPIEPPTVRSESETEVNEQHAFPTALYWKPTDASEAEQVTRVNQFPVQDNRKVRGYARPQISVSASTATLILAANPLRKQVKITNTTGTQVVWVKTDQNVTTTNGDYLGAPAGSNNVYDCADALWGLSATSAQTVSVFETEYVSG